MFSLSCKRVLGGTILITVIVIASELLIYYKLGFRSTFSNNYNPEVTREFVKITISIVGFIWTIVAVFITYQTLVAQRRQLEVTNIQHFENKYYELLRRQWEIRNTLIFQEDIIIYSSVPTLVTLRNERYFEGLYWVLYNLYEAHKENLSINSSDEWYRDSEQYDARIQFTPVDWHERPEWCEQAKADNLKKLKAVYTSYLFMGKMDEIDNVISAFRLVYNKYLIKHDLYFRHFKMTIIYLQRQTKITQQCENMENYLIMMKANMTRYELLMLYYYSQCMTDIYSILQEHKFFNDIEDIIIKE